MIPKPSGNKIIPKTTPKPAADDDKKEDPLTDEKQQSDETKKKALIASGDKEKDPHLMSQEALNQFYSNPLMHMQYYQKGMHHPFGMPPHPGMHPYFSMPPGVPLHPSYHQSR